MGNIETFLNLYARAHEEIARRQQQSRSRLIPGLENIWSRADGEWSRLTIAQRREAIRRNPSITWRYNV